MNDVNEPTPQLPPLPPLAKSENSQSQKNQVTFSTLVNGQKTIFWIVFRETFYHTANKKKPIELPLV